jgi:hypothetical protein
VPITLLNKVYPFTYKAFGVTSQEDKDLLKRIITGSPTKFLKWAINEVLNWKNNSRPKNIYHIHGSADHIFPIGLTKADFKIQTGGHLIVHMNANTVSQILTEQLDHRL